MSSRAVVFPALASCLGLLVGCGLQLPNGPPGVEEQKRLEAERDAREAAELEARQRVRDEVAAHGNSFRWIADRAKPHADKCPELPFLQAPPRARAKLLIWDAVAGELAEAHTRLPAEVRATDPTQPVSVLLITKTRRRPLNIFFRPIYAQEGGKKGYEVWATVCLVEMPTGEPRTRVELGGKRPTGEDARRQADKPDVTGDWAETVAEWAMYSATGIDPKSRKQ
jgi:hypothetical protein